MKNMSRWLVPALFLGLFSPAAWGAERATDYIAKGNQLANTKQYEKAVEQYQKALQMNPKDNRTALVIGLCYAQSGDLDKGLSYVQGVAKKNPSYTALYNLGLIYSARMESEEALNAFDRALAINPKSAEAEYQKGIVYTNLKKYDQAIVCYQKALALNPSLDNARVALFGAFFDQGDHSAALAEIQTLRKMGKTSIAQALQDRMGKMGQAVPKKA